MPHRDTSIKSNRTESQALNATQGHNLRSNVSTRNYAIKFARFVLQLDNNAKISKYQVPNDQMPSYGVHI